MTKDDYMRLPKERLAELLVEMEQRICPSTPIPSNPIPTMPATPSGWMCDGTHCTNPHHDCINCPIKFTSGGITYSNSM